MEKAHLSNETKNSGVGIVRKIFFIVLDYVRFGPLIFVSLYFITLVVVLLVQTDYESFIHSFFSFFLGSTAESRSYNQDDVRIIISRIWFIFGTVFELINKFFKFEIKGTVMFLLTALVLLVLSIMGAIKIGSYGVFLTFYILSLVSLGLFFLISKGIDYLEKLLDKIQGI